MRRLWRTWRDRRIIHGRYFDIKIEGRWWSPTDRRAAKVASLLCDFTAHEYRKQINEVVWAGVLYGEGYSLAHFVPDEWPYPDDPPDPL